MSTEKRFQLPRIKLSAVETGLLIAVLALNAKAIIGSIEAALQPRGLTYTEGVNAILASRPDLWFHPVAEAPHFPTIYPLGYHALTFLTTTITGLSPFLVMHGIGLLSGLAGAVLVALLVRHETDGWLGPGAAALLYGLSPAVSGATVLGRVDHLGVALGLLALLYARQDRHKRSAVATVAAMYVKHSLIVFPATILGYYLYKRHWDAAIGYANIVIFSGLGILLALTYLTNGEAFRHLVQYNSNHPWLFSVLAGQVVWFSYTHAVLIGVLAYAAVRWRSPPMAGIFGIVAVATALITVGKVGSWVGYFLPTIAASAWLFGHYLSQADVNGRAVVRAVIIVALVAQLGLYVNWAGQMSPKYAADHQERVLEDVKADSGPILAEDGTLYVETGYKQVHEPLMMRFVYDYPGYEGDTLADEIRDKRFNHVIVGQSFENWEDGDTSRWHEKEIRAIQRHYRLDYHVGDYYVYVPDNA